MTAFEMACCVLVGLIVGIAVGMFIEAHSGEPRPEGGYQPRPGASGGQELPPPRKP